MPSPSRRRATKRRRSSITDLSIHGINTSRKAKSVTHVPGTKCHLCLGSDTPFSVRSRARLSAPGHHLSSGSRDHRPPALPSAIGCARSPPAHRCARCHTRHRSLRKVRPRRLCLHERRLSARLSVGKAATMRPDGPFGWHGIRPGRAQGSHRGSRRSMPDPRSDRRPTAALCTGAALSARHDSGQTPRQGTSKGLRWA